MRFLSLLGFLPLLTSAATLKYGFKYEKHKRCKNDGNRAGLAICEKSGFVGAARTLCDCCVTDVKEECTVPIDWFFD